GQSYFQPYTIIEKQIDPSGSMIEICNKGRDTVMIRQPMFQLYPTGAADFVVEGEVVFAGYGIKANKYSYNDLENISPEGKILLIMDRSPLSEDGSRYLFEEPMYQSFLSI